MGIMKNVVAGKFKGNVGAFKFAQSAGRDVVSERVYTNKSKGFGASYKQRVQRCKLMNLANVYGAYKALFAKAFEGKKAAQSPYNAFTSANLGTSNIHLTKEQAEGGCFSSVGLIISKGSLPSIYAGPSGDDGIVFNIKMGRNFVWENATVGTVSTALLANNDFLQNGDQITIVKTEQNLIRNLGGFDGQFGYNEKPVILEFTIDIAGTAKVIEDPYFMEIFDGEGIDWDQNGLVVNSAGGVAVILSRRFNGRLLVSTQRMIDTGFNDEGYTLYSSAENLAAAVASYGSQELALLDPGSEAQPNA